MRCWRASTTGIQYTPLTKMFALSNEKNKQIHCDVLAWKFEVVVWKVVFSFCCDEAEKCYLKPVRAKRNLLLQISRSPTYPSSNSFDPGSPSCKAAAAPMFMIVIMPFLCVCEEGLWWFPQGLYHTYVSFQFLDILKILWRAIERLNRPRFVHF